jgi:hypothetical protein
MSAANADALARHVAHRRGQLGMTQKELAARAGMVGGYIECLEQLPTPSVSTESVFALADALGVAATDLMARGVVLPPGQTGAAGGATLDTLSVNQCQQFLPPGGVGRIVFGTPQGPVDLPVNDKLTDEGVVCRTSEANGIASATVDVKIRVAFSTHEADTGLRRLSSPPDALLR